MLADSRKYLWDAQKAASRIKRFTAGRSFDDYLDDDMLRAAVERQFEIIGEALNRLSAKDPDTADRVIGFQISLTNLESPNRVREAPPETFSAKRGRCLRTPRAGQRPVGARQRLM